MSVAFPRYGRCQIPAFGIGTYELRGDECVEAVRGGLQAGFRLLDTAAGYHNEQLVGQGIRESGVPREDIFVVIKISPKSFVAADKVKASIEESIASLGIGYADLALMHWPGCGGLKPEDAEGHSAARQRTYGAMRELQASGRVRWLGVSNFLPHHFKDIEKVCGISLANGDAPGDDFPVVNQIELHPLCIQAACVAWCDQHRIVSQQYSPLGKGEPALLQHPKLAEVVRTEFPGYSVADVLLMWGLSRGYCTLVRSRSKAHHESNVRAGRAVFAPEGHPHALTPHQHRVLSRLRELLGVGESEDTHFAWFSSHIA